ncbi:hypothetical protein BH20GEM1_BH20GEM1_19850 [soil metagenome]
MRSGTRVALGCLLFATVVFAVLSIYGRSSLSRGDTDTPETAARLSVQADNTAVGLVGGISVFEPVDVERWSAGGIPMARVVARVIGARDSGRLIADMAIDNGRWLVRRATFTLSDGTTIPVIGSAGR